MYDSIMWNQKSRSAGVAFRARFGSSADDLCRVISFRFANLFTKGASIVRRFPESSR